MLANSSLPTSLRFSKIINHVILIAKMCISMYKKTNAFLSLSMIFENQLRLRKFNREKPKNQHCTHCDQGKRNSAKWPLIFSYLETRGRNYESGLKP